NRHLHSFPTRRFNTISRQNCFSIINYDKLMKENSFLQDYPIMQNDDSKGKGAILMSMIQSRALTDILVGDLMIPSEKVAHVQINNPLEHALLVLVKSGYSAVPVLDASYRLVGTIGKTVILNQRLGMERFEIEKLYSIKVEEVMHQDIPTLAKDDRFLDGLNMVINYPFVCVVNESGYFDGIVTRRAILKAVKRDIYITKTNQ